MKATNIIWDVDEIEDLEFLPTELELPESINKDDTDEIGDYLSSVTGFCHRGYELVEEKQKAYSLEPADIEQLKIKYENAKLVAKEYYQNGKQEYLYELGKAESLEFVLRTLTFDYKYTEVGSGRFLESLVENSIPKEKEILKHATILVCRHETRYGIDVYASVHPDSTEALNHVEKVQETCGFDEDKANVSESEYFNFDILEQVIDVNQLKPVIIEKGNSIKKLISGVECECFEANKPGDMRLHLEGTFGNTTQKTFMLVPLSFTEVEIEKLSDFWLSEQEKELGLPVGQSCDSSSWWIGSDDSTNDHFITDKYDFLLPHVIDNEEIRQNIQNDIHSLYKRLEKLQVELEKEYQDGETNWAAQLEIQCEDLENAITNKESLLKNSYVQNNYKENLDAQIANAKGKQPTGSEKEMERKDKER